MQLEIASEMPSNQWIEISMMQQEQTIKEDYFDNMILGHMRIATTLNRINGQQFTLVIIDFHFEANRIEYIELLDDKNELCEMYRRHEPIKPFSNDFEKRNQ